MPRHTTNILNLYMVSCLWLVHSNEDMVLQLVYGLSDAYPIVGSQIYHSEILPPFYKARSMVA